MVCNKSINNYEKTCFLQFQTKNSKTLDIQVSYSNNFNVSFLELKIDNLLTWKDHIDAIVIKLDLVFQYDQWNPSYHWRH
jgi:hypothetical protein